MSRMITLASVVGVSSAIPISEFLKIEESDLGREVTTLGYSNGCSDKLADFGNGRMRVWHDSDSSFFNCYIYAKYGLCTAYGDYGAWPQNNPMTARTACCTCGGGEYPANTPAPQTDAPQMPSTDAPQMPLTDAPQMPSTDAPQMPLTDAPQMPSTDAPQQIPTPSPK